MMSTLRVHLACCALLVVAGVGCGGDGSSDPATVDASADVASDASSSDVGPADDVADADPVPDAGDATTGADTSTDAADDAASADVASDASDASDTPTDAADTTEADAGADVEPDAGGASDTGPDVVADTGGAADTPEVERIVIAGDSWSTGSVRPLIELLPDRGFGDIAVTYEATALAGSQAREWVANHEGKLDALDAALDAEPVAEVLLLFIGGNDFNFAMLESGWSQRRRDRTIDDIEGDIEALVRHALDGRPWLTVVLMDYSWFNYPKMRAVYGFDIAPNLADFNDAYARMGERKRAVAARVAGVEYAHHFGVLQNAWGDVEQVYPFEPFVVPGYEPGFFAAPGMAPDYAPYPGGNAAFPGPTEALFDGLHLTDDAMRVLLDHTLRQGLAEVLRGETWAPVSWPPDP